MKQEADEQTSLYSDSRKLPVDLRLMQRSHSGSEEVSKDLSWTFTAVEPRDSYLSASSLSSDM